MEAIEDFEADTAIEILQELHTTDMDPVIIEKVCRASELIDDFEYDEAVEILKKLLDKIEEEYKLEKIFVYIL